MQIKKSHLKNVSILISLLIGLVIFFILLNNKPNLEQDISVNPVSTAEGVQIIEVTAKGGYFPSVIEAKANVNTILRITTKNTFDCSLAFTIPKLGIQKNLVSNGKTDIALNPQSVGSEITGMCSMGMYSFKIKFN